MEPGRQFKHTPGNDAYPNARGGEDWTPSPGRDYGSPINVDGLTFKYSRVMRGRKQPDVHWLTAHNSNGGEMGQLVWDSETGRIAHTYVGDRYRGLGVATSLQEHAHRLADLGAVVRPKHSNNRTEAGDALARAVGGALPKNKQMPDHRRTYA